MKIKRWQLVWTLLPVLWLAASASPMVMIQLRGDTYQLNVYFGMWVAVVLIPTIVVYVVGLVFGIFAITALRDFDRSRPASWKTLWLLASIGWAVLVGLFLVVAPGPLNPFYSFAWPLATAIALLIVLLPPVVVYAASAAIARFPGSLHER